MVKVFLWMDTIGVCIWRMFDCMSVVVTVGMFVVYLCTGCSSLEYSPARIYPGLNWDCLEHTPGVILS